MNEYFFIFIVLGVVAVVILIAFFNKKAIIKRKLKKVPRKQISKFASGEIAKISGTIEFLGEPLIAPLSGRKCAYYYTKIEKKTSSRNSSGWHTLIEEEVVGDFLIKEGNDYAFVDTKKISSYLVQDKRYRSGFLNDAEVRLERYLEQHGESSTGIFGFNKTLRYKEGVLEQGETVAVLGKAHWKSIDQSKLQTPSGKVLMISSYEKEPVYLSDDPDAFES